jgi:hypothetical protein
MSHTTTPTISIRAATAGDGRTLMRLAALDSSPMPFGPTLIAEVDGEPQAALSLRDGRAIGDPFHRTAELIGLMRLHAEAIAQTERPAERRVAGHRALRLAA